MGVIEVGSTCPGCDRGESTCARCDRGGGLHVMGVIEVGVYISWV